MFGCHNCYCASSFQSRLYRFVGRYVCFRWKRINTRKDWVSQVIWTVSLEELLTSQRTQVWGPLTSRGLLLGSWGDVCGCSFFFSFFFFCTRVLCCVCSFSRKSFCWCPIRRSALGVGMAVTRTQPAPALALPFDCWCWCNGCSNLPRQPFFIAVESLTCAPVAQGPFRSLFSCFYFILFIGVVLLCGKGTAVNALSLQERRMWVWCHR